MTAEEQITFQQFKERTKETFGAFQMTILEQYVHITALTAQLEEYKQQVQLLQQTLADKELGEE